MTDQAARRDGSRLSEGLGAGAEARESMHAYHFCAEFNEAPGVMHVFSGVITADADPFHPEFYSRLVARIADEMKPPRPADRVVLRSLSLLASK